MTVPSDIAPGVRFDHERRRRLGVAEAVWCEGKPDPTLATLLRRFAAPDAEPVLFTRLDPAVWARLELPEETRAAADWDALSRTAWFRRSPDRPTGRVAVVSAGTCDGPVAHEAARALTFMGRAVSLFEDRGVSGLWRLTEALPEIERHDVIIVVAGLDAALASVLGGLCGRPIFAVPTSVGYGVARRGRAALASMLSSCAPGVAVLNIDNGYGAACAAERALRLLEEVRS